MIHKAKWELWFKQTFTFLTLPVPTEDVAEFVVLLFNKRPDRGFAVVFVTITILDEHKQTH